MRFFVRLFGVLSLAISLSAGPADASIRIDDPKNHLARVDQITGRPEFTDAFRCGDVAEFEENQCRRRCRMLILCEDVCDAPVRARVSVSRCDAQSVALRRDTPSGSSETVLTKADYEAYSWSYFHYYLNVLGNLLAANNMADEHRFKDFVEIKDTAPLTYVIPGQGSIDALDVMLVFHDFDQNQGKHIPYPLTVTLGKGVPLVAQILKTSKPEIMTPSTKLLSFQRTH